MPLDPADPEPVERAAYDASYKGVTDALTLYLWRKPAFYITRWAARTGLAPNFITLVGAILCVLAFVLFWRGEYWWGVLSGFVFMVLDTVDGKLARCTGASSKWGEVFDHGIDLIHPPFWWWAWLHGLAAYGRPLSPVYATMVLWAIIGGYVLQRIIEGLFIKRFNGMHIHVWRRIDSQIPADYRAAQPEHGDPGRRAAGWTARHRAGAGRAVDDRQPDLPRGAPGAGERAGGARAQGRFLAGSMSFTAIVLAGSRPGRDAFAESFGTELKALIPVAGEPMVRRPVRALIESKSVGRVVVLSQAAQQIAAVLPDGVEVRESQGTIAATMLDLCSDATIEWPLLVTTADHALLDAATVDEFCREAAASDIAIGVVERTSLMRRLPNTRRTWLKFRGGAYTGANLFALRSPAVAPAIELWRSVEQDRKKGWRLFAQFGPAVLLGAGLRLLSIDQVLDRIGRKLGLTIEAVRLSNPLAGVDVDKAEDHALAEAILEGRT